MMKATFFVVLCVASCAHALTIVPEGGAIVSGHKNYDAAAKELDRKSVV